MPARNRSDEGKSPVARVAARFPPAPGTEGGSAERMRATPRPASCELSQQTTASWRMGQNSQRIGLADDDDAHPVPLDGWEPGIVPLGNP